ncbi:MAG TPA: vWA domain-containing protein [Thermoanaerobaculia bacterium]|nr:vWA domain-containing protein [Thermoanaerobaculia bacterium]
MLESRIPLASPLHVATLRTRRTSWRGIASLALLAGLLAPAPRGAAETCWVYADTQNAAVPLKCVQKSDLTTPCSYGSFSSPNDCTAVLASSPQTILRMHDIWHSCFGAVGGPVPPAGRGQRWYAFHRQFELDYDAWRAGVGFPPVESLNWCSDMNLPYGTSPTELPASGPGSHPQGCGTGTPRPDNVSCPQCISFAQCLFLPGAGPACPAGSTPPSATCETPDHSVSFPGISSLDQFANVDDVAKILDGQFHGIMHGAVAAADNPGFYNQDNNGSTCSPRDGMFWRLHKALDDVVRAWQDSKAVDVVVVLDRSGSMGDPDSSGVSKLAAALTAVDNFADLLETSRTDGQVNRMGLVSFSDGAVQNMAMTAADGTLRNVGGPLETAITTITGAGPGGCTGLGGGIEQALKLLCPPSGDCAGFAGAGNPRKAILLMTDGIENVPHCLQPAGASGPTCGSQCFGAQFDYAKLAFTQVVTVGFGNAASLDGALLTLLAERQGGIYLQNPGGSGDDLKHFFAKAFGKLTDEFVRVDPTGVLAAADGASPPVDYNSCGDQKLTFASGWQQALPPGALRLQVRTPKGDLVRRGGPGVQASADHTWDFARIKLPQGAPTSGAWSAQLIRPHRVYANGFTPDSFADPAAGTDLVRRQIQRLCPDGCKRALYFEAGRRGAISAYERALAIEKGAGLVGAIAAVTDPAVFQKALSTGGPWDLIVYAYMGPDVAEPYDTILSNLVCERQRAILTDTRAKNGGPVILRCGGALRDGPDNWNALIGDGKLLAGGLGLKNPGHPIFSYGLRPTSAQSQQQAAVATSAAGSAAVTAILTPGKDAQWFLDVLGRGLAKLDLHNRSLDQRTGDELFATVRILPSYIPAGGFDHVDARVEVEYPRIGLGTLLSQQKGEPRRVNGELLDARVAALEKLTIPTAKATFPLFDDGTHGDLLPGNDYWTAALTGLGATDGIYTLHFIFDLTKNGCTTHRELTASVTVDVRVDPRASGPHVVSQTPTAIGGLRTVLQITPADRFGNLWGPGRLSLQGCSPAKSCSGAPQLLADSGTGTYTVAVETAPAAAGVRLAAAGTSFDLPVPCPRCPKLAKLDLAATRSPEHSFTKGTVSLAGPAPEGGAAVFLTSVNRAAASVPEVVVVPAGQTQATFEVTLLHAHDGPSPADLTALYGDSQVHATVTVVPLRKTTSKGEPPAQPAHPHVHMHMQQEPVKPPPNP